MCIGGPPEPHVTIFDPDLYIPYAPFMGLRWRLRVAYIGNLRVYILIVVIGTPKKHILGRNDVFWCIFGKNPYRGVGCSELQEPQKASKTSPHADGTENHVYGEQKPLKGAR